jgi:hypothetical protein
MEEGGRGCGFGKGQFKDIDEPKSCIDLDAAATTENV